MVGSLAGAGNVAIVDSPTIVTASIPHNRTELWAYISIQKDHTPKCRVGLSRTAEKGVARLRLHLGFGPVRQSWPQRLQLRQT